MKLIIVCHPDDESIFSGAKLLQSHYKVICITNGNNLTRRKEFEKVMEMTNSDFEIWNYPDIFKKPFDEDSLINDLQRVIDEKEWDSILTHNEIGEYNNTHHTQVHDIMKKLVDNLSAFEFSDKPLPDDLWQHKLKLIQVYASQKKVCKRFLGMARMEKI